MDFVKELKSYMEQLEQRYGKEVSGKIFLIKSMVLTYRLLEDRGIKFPLPVALVMDSRWTSQRLSYVVKGLCPVAYGSTDISDKKLGCLLEKYCSESLLIQYIKSKNTEPCLERLAGICESGMVGHLRFRDPIFVTFSEGIPVNAAENFAGKIILEGMGCPENRKDMTEAEEIFTRRMIEQMEESWQVLDYKISELSASEEFQRLSQESAGAEVWPAVRWILEFLIERSEAPLSDKEDCRKKIGQAEEQIKKSWDVERISEDWCEIFRKMLFRAAKNIPGICKKQEIRTEDLQSGQDRPFYDDQFYYISEGMFGRICSLIGEGVGTQEMKEILAEQGFIKKEGQKRKYYTRKVPLVTVEGEIFSPRMICLYRDQVDLAGRVKWVDKIRRKERRS